MSKVVVRFAIRIRLQSVSDVPAAVLPDGTPVVVEWKRGKHHGLGVAAPCAQGRVGELRFACVLR